ncbi:MAG: ATP-dependent endonuclease [Candidatus Electrothrix sp. AR3]|nr:ATP-dependent endonuclease [Candidatus Electrothrix sp. AR3]
MGDDDKSTFKKYLTSTDEIRVRKTAYIGGNFDYKGYIENPVEEFLQEQNAGSYTKREIAESLPFHPYIPDAGRILKQNIIDAQKAFIENNEVEFNYELEQTNFLGLKSVAKGIFGDVYFIPAIKDASEDFTTKEASAFGKLYSSVINAMSESNGDWRDTKDKLSTLFGTLNKVDADGNTNENRPQELTNFEEELGKELEHWGAEIDVEVIPPNIDDVFRANTQVWVNDGVRTDIRRKGHGLQRALTFALIKVVSDQLKKLREQEEDDAKGRAASKSTYFILEEPELYLHPQAQRALFDSLVSLSESKNQVLLCTHASALIDVEKYSSICIVKKDSDEEGTKICQFTGELFVGDNKKDFNLAYWLNPDRSELFFAKKVVLVEGPTDKTIIPLLAKSLGIFKYEVTLVDCGSKTAIPLYARLLNSFSIPYVAVYDQDHQAHKNQQAIDAANRDTALVEAEINTEYGKSIVFVNDIEEELGLPDGNKSKPYVALSHISDDGFTLSQQLESKIREIYE